MMGAFEMLAAGNITQAVLEVYVGALSPVGFMFYAILVFIGLAMIYIKTENFGTVGVVGFLIASASLPYIPEIFHPFAYVMLFFSATVVIAKVFRG